jgi:putative membrane protein (TIGR04086 family)
MVLWVARKLESRFILHGVLVGVLGVLLTVGFIFGAKPEDRLMYVVSFVLRIAGGYLGGVVARTTAA